MFVSAFLIGIYSYLILALGLLGILYKPIIILITTIYILITVYYYRKQIKMNLLRCFETFSETISPVYIIFLPLILIIFKKFKPDIKLIAIYSFLSIVVWHVTPRTGGGRFIPPYLPFFSVLVAAIIENTKDKSFRSVLITAILIVSFDPVFYRGVANAKYIPLLIGLQSKSDFLENRLNFSFGDFYDIDGHFKYHIKRDNAVLLYGFHNLYYADFPFIDSSWVKKGDSFNYIATQNTSLPKRFIDRDLVYQNSQTHVNLYSRGALKWVY